MTGSPKNKKSKAMPIGKGIKIINHIGAFRASVMAPNETTEVPIIRAWKTDKPFESKKLPMK